MVPLLVFYGPVWNLKYMIFVVIVAYKAHVPPHNDHADIMYRVFHRHESLPCVGFDLKL